MNIKVKLKFRLNLDLKARATTQFKLNKEGRIASRLDPPIKVTVFTENNFSF
jgi:hypothetical protein